MIDLKAHKVLLEEFLLAASLLISFYSCKTPNNFLTMKFWLFAYSSEHHDAFFFFISVL